MQTEACVRTNSPINSGRFNLIIVVKNFDLDTRKKCGMSSMDSCETAGITVPDHFREVTKMIMAGKGAQRFVKDYMLTRYACYKKNWKDARHPKTKNCLKTQASYRLTRKNNCISQVVVANFSTLNTFPNKFRLFCRRDIIPWRLP